MQPSTEPLVQAPVLILMGRNRLEIGSVPLPSDDPIGDLVVVLREAADYLERK